MLKKTFFAVFLFFFPFLCSQAHTGYQSHNAYVQSSCYDSIVLSNGAVFKKSMTSPFSWGSRVVVYLNEGDRIVLANPHNEKELLECSFSTLRSEEGLPSLSVDTVDFATTIDSEITLTDGSRWALPSKTNDIKNWRIDDRVFVLETSSPGMYQIFNVDLRNRQPGCAYFICASRKTSY